MCAVFAASGAFLRYPAFLVVAAGGITALLAAVVRTAGPPPLGVRIELGATQGTRGQVMAMALRVDNPTAARTARCVVEVAVPFRGAPAVVAAVPPLEPGGQVLVATQGVRLRQRGSWRLGPAVVRLVDPLGLIARERRAGEGAAIRVHPAFVTVAALPSTARSGPAGRSRAEMSGGGMTFERLREYAWGDEVRAIHWPSVARTGVPLVRTFVEPGVRFCTVVLDVEPLAYAGGDQGELCFEQAVEVAASVAVAAVGARHELRLGAGHALLWPRHHDARTRSSVLDALADVTLRQPGLGAGQRAPGPAVRGAGRGRPGVVVVVTGPAGGPSQAAAEIPIRGAVVVRVGVPGGGTPRVRSAGGALVADVSAPSELSGLWAAVLDAQAGRR